MCVCVCHQVEIGKGYVWETDITCKSKGTDIKSVRNVMWTYTSSERNEQGIDITSKRNEQGLYITCERNVPSTDITSKLIPLSAASIVKYVTCDMAIWQDKRKIGYTELSHNLHSELIVQIQTNKRMDISTS